MDDMEEVRQRFEADVAEYVGEVRAAADEARQFADRNDEAKVSLGGVRDKVFEAAAALKIMRDEQGKLRDSAGEVIAASEAEARALKHIRDEALGAAWAVRELDKYERRGTLSRLLSMFGGGVGNAGGGIPGSAGPVPLAALPAAVAAVEALLVEANGLIAGFSAAGAGAVAFYVLAHPVISNLTQDVSKLDSANQALGIAQQKYLIDPTKANAKALQNAQLQYKAVFNQMGQDAGTAAGGVMKLRNEYNKLSTAFAPEAYKVINAVLNLANQVLPYIAPFAKTFADAISGLLERVSRFTGSSGFKDWLQQFHALEGPSITAIGEGIGKVVNAIGKFLTVQNANDVVREIGIAFNIVAGIITGLTYAIHMLMKNYDAISSAVKHSWYDIKQWAGDVSRAWGALMILAGMLAHDVAAAFDLLRHNIARWVDDVVSFFKALPGRILRALGNLGNLLFNAGKAIIEGLWNGLKAMFGPVISWVQNAASWIGNAFGSVLHIGSPSRVFYDHGVNTLLGYINGVKSMEPQLRAVMRQVGAGVASGGLPGIPGAVGGSAGAPSVHVTVPLTLTAGTQGYRDPQFLQYLQNVVQEAVLRYQLSNPSNGLNLAGRL